MARDALPWRRQHLRNICDRAGVLATAKASLLLCSKRDTFTWIDLDELVLCAVACHTLGDVNEARRFLLAAMDIGLPYGMTAAFTYSLGSLGGLMDECLDVCFPQYREPILAGWEAYFKNWMSFHNRYAKENITTVLNLREYQIAHLIANGATYAEAARHMNLSVGRIKNILTDVYGKLYISGKEQLKDYIL